MTKLTSRGDRMLLKGIAACLLCITVTAHSRAELTWEKDKVELTPEVGEEVIHTFYNFKNTGKTPVSVISVKPSCACVATDLEKFEYAPGESGTIKVTFDVDMDKEDPAADRNIKVITSDAPDAPKTLELKVHVHGAVKVSPEALVWKHGQPAKPKEVVVKANSGIQAMQLVQTAQNDNFPVEITTEVEGQSYRLKITPKNTDAPSNATLGFDVKSPSLKHQVSCEVSLKVD